MLKKSWLFVLICSFVIAQEIEETTFGDPKKVEGNFEKVQKYAPTFYKSKFIDGSIEQEDYKMVKKIIKDVEEIYLTRVVFFLDIAGKGIDKRYRAYDDTYSFKSSSSYFDGVVNFIRNNHHLIRSMSLIQSAYDRYQIIKGLIALDENYRDEAKEIEYKLNKLIGTLEMFRGSPYNLKKALNHYDYIVSPGKREAPLTENRDDLIEIYNYLAGIVHQLYQKNKGDSVYSIYYLRKELYYLWKLTDLQTDDQKLKEYKYKYLLNNYYSIIDFKGNNYFKLYKVHMDKIAESYKSIAEKTSKSETNPSQETSTPSQQQLRTVTPTSGGSVNQESVQSESETTQDESNTTEENEFYLDGN